MPGASSAFRWQNGLAGPFNQILMFTICIFVLGFAAFFGGLWLNRRGPRIVAMTGGLLYGLGVFLGQLLRPSPMVALFKLRRDWRYRTRLRLYRARRRAGRMVSRSPRTNYRHSSRRPGAGALITAPVATRLIQSVGVLSTFAYLGIAFLIVTVICRLLH